MGTKNSEGGAGVGSDVDGSVFKRGTSISFAILLMLAGLSCGNFPVLDVDTNMRIVLVPYDTPVGTIIYRLHASDSDNNFPLSFEVLGSIGKSILSLRPLGCDPTESLCQADVILKKALDKGRSYEFQLQVKDTNGDYTKVHSVITATQGTANFNPTFMPRIIHLDESTPVGTELENFVIAKTLLNSRHVFLEIRDKGDRIALRQRLVSNNQTEGTLLLKKPLDYEKEPWFTFQLLAMNAYTNTTCDTRNILVSQVIVAVHDVQDTPPYFTSLPASVELKSSMRPGDLITQVRAEDGDKQNKRLIRYGFLTDSNPFVVFFNLDPMSGEIHLRRNLTELLTMAKPNEPIEMTVIAEEIIPDSGRLVGGKSVGSGSRGGGGKSHFYDNNSRAMGKITFWFGRDSSFGPADFSSDKYVGEVKENSVAGTLISFGSVIPQVSHQHPKELISLSLQQMRISPQNKIPTARGSPPSFRSSSSPNFHSNDINSHDLEVTGFQVLPSQGSGNFSFEIRVTDSKILDYEQTTEFTMLVVAVTSCGMSSEASLTIHVRDENDEAPMFTQSEYHVELPEHPQKGTKVLQVQATDKDTTGSYGKITYSNLIGSNAFRLDPKTGEITVERPDLIDREVEPEIRLYVEAKDGGYSDTGTPTARNLGTAVVVIKLTDKNDNAPKFFQKYYQAVLNPSLTDLKEPLFVKAYDPDDGVNSQIRYEVRNSGFFVDPLSGEFRLRGGFQRVDDSPFLANVKVYAHDLGNPKMTGEAEIQLFAEEMVTREIQFVFPAPPHKIQKNKTSIEEMLSRLSGGVAHIKTITQFPKYPRAGNQLERRKPGEQVLETSETESDSEGNPARFRKTEDSNDSNATPSRRSADLASAADKSIVTATVQYPVSATPTRVDLSQIPNIYAGSTGKNDDGGDTGTGREKDTDKISVYQAENRALFWILISFLLILLVLFIVFLCCVYCPWCWLYGHCYSKGDKMSREHSGRSLLIEKRRRDSDGHVSRHKTYPEKIEDDEGDYDRDGYGRRPPVRGPRHPRREAWSGDDRKGPWRGSQQQQSPRSMRRYRGSPPPRSRKVAPAQGHEQDVALEDWEFDGGGAPQRQRDQAEEIGSRWQLQQQHPSQVAPVMMQPQGSQMIPMAVPMQVPMQMPMAIPQQQQQQPQPRRVAFGNPSQSQVAIAPGQDDPYLRRSQEIYMPEDTAQMQRNSYAMRPAPRSLPPAQDERAMSHLQQRKTTFFRTETGEVLQFGDYEGDEGKELLMKRYIDEQQPKDLLDYQQRSFESQHQLPPPPPAISQTRLNDAAAVAVAGGSVDRPKAAIVSKRHPKGTSLTKDVTFEDEEDYERSPELKTRSDSKKSRSRRSPSDSDGGGGAEPPKRGKEIEKKQQRRPKSPTPLSEDDSRRSRSPTRRSDRHHQSKSKSRSKEGRSKATRSESPPVKHRSHHSKSKSKSPSRSKSRTRSRSVSPERIRKDSKSRKYQSKENKAKQKESVDQSQSQGGASRQHKLRRHHHIQQSKASSKGEAADQYEQKRLRNKSDSRKSMQKKQDSIEMSSREELPNREKSLEPSLTSLPMSFRDGDEDDETEQSTAAPAGAVHSSSLTGINEEQQHREQTPEPSLDNDDEDRNETDGNTERRRSSIFFQHQSSEDQMHQSMVDINIIPPSSAMTDSTYNPRDNEDRPEMDDEEEEERARQTAISRSRRGSRRQESIEEEDEHQFRDDEETAAGERRRLMLERTDTLPEENTEVKLTSQSTLDIAEAEAQAVAVAPSDSIENPTQMEDGAAPGSSRDLDQIAQPSLERRGGPEDDDDSGIGMAGYLTRRNKMLEKKSVFTIAYDEVAQSSVMRPDTRGSTGEATENDGASSIAAPAATTSSPVIK